MSHYFTGCCGKCTVLWVLLPLHHLALVPLGARHPCTGYLLRRTSELLRGLCGTVQHAAHDSCHPPLLSLPSSFLKYDRGGGLLLGSWLVTVGLAFPHFGKLSG